MINEDSDDRKDSLANGYVSCIRISGVSLLPPIISKEKRVELQYDKQRAIEIERRLKFQRDLKQFLTQFKLADFPNIKPCDKILDDLLFDDISHINALNINLPTTTKSCDTKSDPSNIVPLKDENENYSTVLRPNETKACDYDDELNDANDISKKLSASTVELDLTDTGTSTYEDSVLFATGSQSSVQIEHPLVRSKTFVLQAPSPILLKRLKERPHTSPAVHNLQYEGSELSLSSLCTLIDSSSLQAVSVKNVQDQNNTNAPANNLTLGEIDSQCTAFYLDTCNVLPSSLTLNESTNISHRSVTSETDEQLVPLELEERPLIVKSDTNLVVQHFTSNNLTKNEDTNEQSNQEINLLLPVNSNGNQNHCIVSLNESDNSLLAESQSLIFSNNNTLSTSTPNLIDFESENYGIEGTTVLNQSEDTLGFASACSVTSSLCSTNGNLVSYRPDKVQQRIREQWAAGVLTAAAKGYLVRRLKRTQKVQNLIQTIRDALLCALSLHTEDSELLDLSDVELHRRLILQVSAACSEFYDMFFSLTTKEKMDLIAIDRQRIKDKLKRPKSGTSLKLDSSKSTPKLQRNFSAGRKKSMTSTIAA